MNDAVSGVIDFYFACSDLFAYDLAICMNAWCFELDGAFNVTKAKALFNGYNSVRRLAAGRDFSVAYSCARRGGSLFPHPPL